jgi:GNAT superfamily N-acetyltransferase
MNYVNAASAIGTLAPADIHRATAVLVLAFAHDPVARWQYPNAAEYLKLFPDFVRAFGGSSLGQETARYVGEHVGAALWLPPGAELDHAAIEATLPVDRRAEIAAVLEELTSYHPSKPHWYLPLIGVDPAYQRKGYGTILIDDTCGGATGITSLPIWNPRTPPIYRSINGMDSHCLERSKRDHRRRSFRCCVQRADVTTRQADTTRCAAV